MTDKIENNDQLKDDFFDAWDDCSIDENNVDRTLVRLSEYLLDEVADMFDLIQNIFEEVYTTQENVTNEDRVKKELFAVVDATAKATNTILERAEFLEKISKKLPEDVQQEITEHVTKIYEACTFQDITGQRIKKVVMAILGVETKLAQIMERIVNSSKLKHIVHADESTITKNNKKTFTSDDSLMTGPSLPENANSQDDIDNLFKK